RCFEPGLGKLASYCWQHAGDSYRNLSIVFNTQPSVVLQVVKEIIREDAVIYLQSVFTPSNPVLATLYKDHRCQVSISYWTDSGKRIIENPGVRAISSRR